MRRRVLFGLLLLSCSCFARDKTPYQSTKLLELKNVGDGFCFVLQVGDLAYLADTSDKPGINLIVGDPVEFKIKTDNIWLKVERKYPIGSDTYTGEVKAKIRLRKRMTEGQKLPSCALAISVE
jgi:hypothetical protein